MSKAPTQQDAIHAMEAALEAARREFVEKQLHDPNRVGERRSAYMRRYNKFLAPTLVTMIQQISHADQEPDDR